MIALILGGAPSWEREAKAAAALIGRRHLVVAANLAGIHWRGRLDAHCSLHPERMAEWTADRKARRYPAAARHFVPGGVHALPWAEKAADRWNASSGGYALQCALFEIGATAAILCGVPMDAEAGHFTRPPGASWEGTADYRRGFEGALRECGGRIRSMGGWTANLFGQPTAEWVRSVENIKPVGATAAQHLRITEMHRITNTGKGAAKFWARDARGELVLHRLAPGESTEAEIDPEQPKFQGGGLSVKALSTPTTKAKAAPKKKAPAKAKPKPAPPAPPVADAT